MGKCKDSLQIQINLRYTSEAFRITVKPCLGRIECRQLDTVPPTLPCPQCY